MQMLKVSSYLSFIFDMRDLAKSNKKGIADTLMGNRVITITTNLKYRAYLGYTNY